MIDLRDIPALADDAALNALVETFNARIEAVDSKHHYVGNWTPTVKIGADEYVTLPTVRLVYACHKAELERARATVFAEYLLQAGRNSARDMWLKTKDWESADFMAWCREDIEWKRANT